MLCDYCYTCIAIMWTIIDFVFAWVTNCIFYFGREDFEMLTHDIQVFSTQDQVLVLDTNTQI